MSKYLSVNHLTFYLTTYTGPYLSVCPSVRPSFRRCRVLLCIEFELRNNARVRNSLGHMTVERLMYLVYLINHRKLMVMEGKGKELLPHIWS